MKIALLYNDAKLPTRKNKKDAGIDLYAYLSDMDGYNVYDGDTVIFRTGVTIEVPPGYFGWITNKSSKDWIIGGGIVDETYQGELLVKMMNISGKNQYIVHGDAVAQLLIIPCIHPEIEVVSCNDIHKHKTERGELGGIVIQSKSQFRRISAQMDK